MIRVVVADDHPIVRAGIVALLDAADDIEVVGTASTGLEAVRVAATLAPDVVLMDLRMPELDGDEATARIIAANPATRVVVLTTYETDDAILSAIEAGASGYLLKAAPQAEILAGVRAVAARRGRARPGVAALLVKRAAAPAPAGPALSAARARGAAARGAGPQQPRDREKLFLGEATVKTHLLHAFEKLEVSDRTRAVTRAMELGLPGR